jgi:hypothetical protein
MGQLSRNINHANYEKGQKDAQTTSLAKVCIKIAYQKVLHYEKTVVNISGKYAQEGRDLNSLVTRIVYHDSCMEPPGCFPVSSVSYFVYTNNPIIILRPRS